MYFSPIKSQSFKHCSRPTRLSIMPTLVEKQTQGETETHDEGDETAGPSGLLWLAQNFEGEGNVTNADDSTMSGSFLEATLEDMRRREVARSETQKATETLIQKQDQSFRSRSLSRTLSDDDLLPQQQHLVQDYTEQDPSSFKETLSFRHQQDFHSAEKIDDDLVRSLARPHNDDDYPATRLHSTLRESQLHLPSTNSCFPHFHDPCDFDEPNETSKRSTILNDSNFSFNHKCNNHRSRQERKVGPNEMLYLKKYNAAVTSRIEAFRLSNPGQLPDYRTATDEEKMQEQRRVINLLARLNITNKENSRHEMGECCGYLYEPANTRDVCVHQNCEDSHSTCTGKKDQTEITDNDQSMILLSPKMAGDKYFLSPDLPHSHSLGDFKNQQTMFSPIAANYHADASIVRLFQQKTSQKQTDADCADGQSDDNSSTQSIELPRATTNQRYESPETVRQHKKRLATTSGKRGSDLSRARLDDNLRDSINETCPCNSLVNSIGRLSLGDEQIFFSQSPIAYQMSHSPLQQKDMSTDFAPPDISFGEDENDSDQSDTASRPVYDNDSLVETSILPDKRVRWDFDGKLTKEAPTDVRLLDGKTFHLQKLLIERRQREAPPTQTFPDPLSFYPDKLQRRLGRLYTWLLQRDRSFANDDSVGGAVVLSMHEQQITDVILKLHLQNQFSDVAMTHSELRKHDLLQGNTLIVTRSKDELEVWGRSFREGSCFSVLNHAGLPLTQRKSVSSAEKAVQFDIVLTTYDALKSPDITLTLNSAGIVANAKIGMNDGWYTSASQIEAVKHLNKKFSVLHRVNWRRLIFVDVVGRKSYLVKSGTSRVHAAKAIHAESRFAFFIASDDNETTGMQALLKSDRTALLSLSSVMRLGDDVTSMRESMIVDFQDRSTNLAIKKKSRRSISV